MKAGVLGMRAIRCSLLCYPTWWRQRYGAEQEELAQELAVEGRPPWRIAAGLLTGSVLARLTGSGMPPVPELWSRRGRTSIVVGILPAALALPLELAFVGNVSEHGWSGPSSAAVRLAGAGVIVRWEVTALFLLCLICAVQLLAAGTQLAQGLWAQTPHPCRSAAALLAGPFAAILVGLLMIRLSGSLRPVISGWDKNVITGATHYYYVRRGHPLLATTLLWAGWAGAVGGWAVGWLAIGRATARRTVPADALREGASGARLTALTHGVLVLGIVTLGVTMAVQPPIGAAGGVAYGSDFGPLVIPVIVVLAAVAALSIGGAAAASKASAQWLRLQSQRAHTT